MALLEWGAGEGAADSEGFVHFEGDVEFAAHRVADGCDFGDGLGEAGAFVGVAGDDLFDGGLTFCESFAGVGGEGAPDGASAAGLYYATPCRHGPHPA